MQDKNDKAAKKNLIKYWRWELSEKVKGCTYVDKGGAGVNQDTSLFFEGLKNSTFYFTT